MRGLLWTLAGLLVIGLLLMALARWTALPAPLDPASESAQWLQRGPHPVGFQQVTLVDRDRPTASNNGHAGSPERTLQTNVWFPLNDAGTAVADGMHPLVIHSHGFSSNRDESRYLSRQLASLGYIVMAPEFPLTHMRAPGGPKLVDVVNQPGDVSFLISMALKWNGAQGHMFYQHVDANRIAAMGISLGGLTSTLAAFHPRLGDRRLKAAISLAGPASMFDQAFFAQSSVPFMMVAGDIDAIVPYDRNAEPLLTRAPGSTLVTLRNASHTGFADAARWLRWMDNPDALGCAVVKHRDPGKNPDDFYPDLKNGSRGIIEDRRKDFCVTQPLPAAMNALHQQRLTALVVSAFLQSHLASDADSRDRARHFLLDTLPAEQADVTVNVIETPGTNE